MDCSIKDDQLLNIRDESFMGSLTSGVKADNFEDVSLGSLTSVAVTDQPSKTEDDSLLINGDDSIFKQSNKIMEESLDQIDGKIGE